MHRAALVPAAIAAATAIVACGSSGPETTPPPSGGTPTVVAPTPGSLPFHYQTLGESSSPSFHVDTAGSYTVAYVLKGSDQTPNCSVTIAMVADDGTARQVVPGIPLQPADTKQGSVKVDLTAATWRFQEGGGCSWDVTVSLG